MDSFLEQKPSITSNVIVIKPEEKRQCYEILSNNVTIIGSGGRHDHGSSKVKLKNIVDYKWEAKSYPGHLIAAHIDGKTIAYVIKVSNKLSGVEGMVRVTDAYSGQRTLIKGMTGEVLDLQFAHIERKHILACIDESCLHVHKIDTLSENLICNLLLKINDPMQMHTPKYDKVSWCPYVPEEYSDEEDDISQLLVWSRGDTFQCFNVNTIINSFGIGSHAVSEITDGYLRLTDNSTTITWVALSPDGTTLGVGSEEGYINFYQVYFHEKEPRRLHQWNPHNGKAISSFFFLDNLTKTSADAYWKYALTGADQNTEFKIWDCGTWECLQTVYISTVEKQKMNFITEIDRTASYLVVSSVDTRTLYVFQISNGEKEVKQENDSSKNDNLDVKETTTKRISSVFIKSVSEFPLSSPTLSFSIIDAAVRKYKCELNDNYLLEEMDDYEEETNVLYCVVVRLFVVQPKSVQECHILYQPSIDDSCDVKSSISNESLDDLKGTVAVTNLSQVIKVEKTEENPTISEQQINNVFEKRVASSCSPPSKTPTKTSDSFPQLNLMTPESFVSSGKKSPECVSSEVLSTLLMLASVTGSTSSANKPENMNLLNLVNNKIIEDQEHQKLKEAMAVQKNYMSAEVVPGRKNSDLVTSGGSSPSREVQEIMSLQDYECNSYFKEEANDTSTKDQSQTSFSTVQANQKITNCNDKKKEKDTDAANVHIWAKSYDMKSSPKSSVSATENEIAKLNIKISQLINIAEKQSSEISELRKEVIETKKINSDSFLNIKDHVVKIEKGLSKILEEHMVRYDKELNRTLENFMSARDIQNRELRGSIMHLLNQFLFNQFTEKLTNILIMEVQKHVVPVLVAKLDLIKQQVQAEVALKLTTTDKVLKENIAQVCKSKSIIDAFGNSVLMGVQNGLQATYIESMTNTLIPAYEKSSQEMFKQLHDTFSLGIKDVMEQFDNYLSQLQPVQDSTDEVLDKIDDLKKSLHSDHIKQRTSFNDALLEIRKDFKCSENNLSKNLSEIIQSEIRKGFESQAASLEGTVLSAVRSQTQTPAPSIQDVQGQIKQLLNSCQVNKAFHQALLANDLTLVEYTLEKADYKTVFNPCVLDQTVLLSLIQQISADLNNHNDIKQRYLSDGILNLDQNDPVTKEHAPKVMAELYRNCQRFLSFNSKSHLCSNIRMIMMAIQGMGYKMF